MRRSTISLVALVALGASGAVQAQMMERPYSFQPRDRVGIAFSMRAVEDRQDQSASGGGSGEITQVVCGGADGQTGSATSNMACIFVGDGANAAIGADQVSDGDQTATSTSSVSNSSANAIADALNGETAASD